MTVTYLPYINCSSGVQASAKNYVSSCFFGEYDPKNITVAAIQQKVVGILVYAEPTAYYKNIVGRPSVYLLHVKVDEEHRRKGIAASLINETLGRLQNLALFVEVVMPKEGTPDICHFIKRLDKVKELRSYSLEKVTYMRYIIENARDGIRGSGKAANP